jgi:hypothetical protein
MRRLFFIKVAIFFIILISISVFSISAQEKIPPPKSVIGFSIGEDYKLANWNKVVEYFKLLDSVSDRVLLQELGSTTMGKPFILVTISAPENLANLDRYKAIQQKLADPRKINNQEANDLISQGKTIVLLTCTIHSTEIASLYLSMRLAYKLANDDSAEIESILDNVILLLVPSLNPDGIDIVTDWYNKTKGTRYEGTSPPVLYHKYVDHDNNRDWYMLTQIETKLAVEKIHNVWHPQIIYDMHQMGSNGARFFLPPFIDPIDPNVDPLLVQEINMMGSFMAQELTAKGKKGVLVNAIFDAWTPARAYQHYHGGIRILSEAASARLASPVDVDFEKLSDWGYDPKRPSWNFPSPWPGGKWHLKDIIEYEEIAAMACLTNAARWRDRWLRNFYLIGKRAVERHKPPYAFIIPEKQRDPATIIKVLQILQKGQVEVSRALQEFNVKGTVYPSGTFIIPLAQPYGAYAKTLLEKQKYPILLEYPGGPPKRPYDVTTHNLPLLMGIDVVPLEEPIEIDMQLLKPIEQYPGKLIGGEAKFAYLFYHQENNSYIAVNRLLANGYKIYWAADPFTLDKTNFPAGTIIALVSKGMHQRMKSMIDSLSLRVYAHNKSISERAYELKQPRLALYQSWIPSVDEGWTRWVLEQFEFPYQTIHDEDIRKGSLHNKFDVIILPDQQTEGILNGHQEGSYPPEYCGGIGAVGSKMLKEFVIEGGTLICHNSSWKLPVELFWLPISNSVERLSPKEFYCPGSILKVLVDSSHPIAFGFDKEAEVMISRSPAFDVKTGQIVAKYPLHNPLLSGFLWHGEQLYDKAAIVEVVQGKGKIILLGIKANYRAQSHNSFRFLFNSILYGAATLTRIP